MPAKVSPILKVLIEIRNDARQFRQSVESRFERIEGRLGDIDDRFAGVDDRFGRLEGVMVRELTANRKALEDISTILRGWRDRYDVRLEDHESRLRSLEKKTG